jgi:NAD+ diphosphatase
MRILFTNEDSKTHERASRSKWFLFSGSRLLVLTDGTTVEVPLIGRPDDIGATIAEGISLGSVSGIPCFAANLPKDAATPANAETRELRNLYGVLDQEIFEMALRAYHFAQWNKTYRFCATCSGELEAETNVKAKKCTRCGRFEFPRLSPAIIVLVERDGAALLGRSPRFAGEFYSVLAGFVEPGESLEGAVHREIMEEVGIRIKNVRYFGSQPWPFPDSLMIGFLAEYESGEIKVDGEEILEANWYRPEDLPSIPGKISIARQLIDSFVEKYSSQDTPE